VLTTLGPPLTVITALLIYFGWDRSQQQARYMGLDVSLFGYSTQDYVLRSVSTLYLPLLALAALALGWLAVHRRIRRRLARGSQPPLRLAGRLCWGGGLLSAAVLVAVATVHGGDAPLLLPLALALAAALTAYGSWLAEAAADPAPQPVSHRALRSLLVGAVVTLGLFWQLSVYAGVVGRGSALQIAASVPALPRATGYSAKPLMIGAPGVTEERLATPAGAAASAVLYRTTGLRLLVRSSGRLFFVHDGWTPRSGVVVVLPDDDAVRWEFSR
jgi:uncharacterized membrane protein YecN with MAPEG domain